MSTIGAAAAPEAPSPVIAADKAPFNTTVGAALVEYVMFSISILVEVETPASALAAAAFHHVSKELTESEAIIGRTAATAGVVSVAATAADPFVYVPVKHVSSS